jgi:hypothetical protein
LYILAILVQERRQKMDEKKKVELKVEELEERIAPAQLLLTAPPGSEIGPVPAEVPSAAVDGIVVAAGHSPVVAGTA